MIFFILFFISQNCKIFKIRPYGYIKECNLVLNKARIFGVAFLLLVTLAGLSMENPPEAVNQRRQPLTASVIISQKPFPVLYLAMFAGLAAGFTVNANLKELYAASSLQTGITAVSLFAIANAGGRIIWGVIADRITSAAAIQMNLICQAVVFFGAT